MLDFSLVDERIGDLAKKNCFPAAQLCVMLHGKRVHEYAVGRPDPNAAWQCGGDTRFDVASLSKLFSGSAFLALCREGVFSLDEPVSRSFPQFTGLREIRATANALVTGVSDEVLGHCDAGKVTWRNVLVHNAGLGWAPLQQRCQSAQQVADYICAMPFAYEMGSTVLYTDLGLILMGMAMERRCGKPLDVLVEELVCRPLGLAHTGYHRVSQGPQRENTAPTEFCAWRNCRVHGLVHDENAYFLDGVAGHAGVFSTAADVAALGQSYLFALQGKDGGLVSQETARQLVKFQQMNSWDRRGILFQLRILDTDAHSFALSRGTFGHTGFTGCCMWVDPQRDMVFSLLTNDVYNGRDCRTLGSVRKSIVEALVAAIDMEECNQ